MKLLLALIVILAGFVPAKLKMESACQQSQPAALSLDLREKIGQSAFVAVLGGFRSVVADLLFIDAYSAWERTDWAQLLLRLRQATELQPRATLFWEMAGWHMAWNAGTAALEDESKSPATRRRLQSEYLKLGEDFLVSAERKNGNHDGTLARPHPLDGLGQTFRLGFARDARRDFAVATSRFHDEDVGLHIFKPRGLQNGLIMKTDIAGIEEGLFLAAEHDASGTDGMTGVVKLKGR